MGMLLLGVASGCAAPQPGTITAFSGSASKPAMEEAARSFEQGSGIHVFLNFGGSGVMLSQMKLGKSGDVYVPTSPDFMLQAEREGVVAPGSPYLLSYLVPVIVVPAGNPKNIRTLADLARPGVSVAIGNPEAVSIGRYAVEILEKNGRLVDVAPNIVTQAENVSRLTALVALGSVDAVLAWRINSIGLDTVEAVYLEPAQLPRIAYISGAVATFSQDRESARQFLDFLVSPRGKGIFQKWGYIAAEEEARKYAPAAKIGGEYSLPEEYRVLLK